MAAATKIDIVTGDDAAFVVTLYRDGETFVIPSIATISCGVVTRDHKHRVIGPAASAEGGLTDWSVSSILVEFSAAQTSAAIPRYNEPLVLEVQITNSGVVETYLSDELSAGSLVSEGIEIFLTKGLV